AEEKDGSLRPQAREHRLPPGVLEGPGGVGQQRGRRATEGDMRDFNIDKMRTACRAAAETLKGVAAVIRPGITTDDINRWVHNDPFRRGGYPAPLNYRGFPKSCCTSVYDVVCHGIPGPLLLKEGDIVNVDVTTVIDCHFG